MTTAYRASRELIHRANDREVLVSTPWRAADGTYRCTTVTTDLSTYYLDHPAGPRSDLVLLTEACRQAALGVTHRFEGLSPDIAFFINTIEVAVSGVPAPAGADRELVITTAVERMRLRGNGSPKQITYSQHGPLGPGDAGVRAAMTVQGVPKDQYRELRAYQRGGSGAPTTADLRPGTHGRTGLAAPSAVGRRIAANVVLAGLRTGAERSSARLAPDFSNASLFDHDYDHFPAMVLIEGGRQLALAGTGDPRGRVATGLRAEFLRFAELDRPTTFTARRHGDRTEVVCAQDDVTVSRMSFTLAPLGEAA